MNTRSIVLTAIAGAFAVASSSHAHHSASATYDINGNVEVTGELVELKIRSPHSEFVVDAANQDGAIQRWTIESAPAHVLKRRGWDGATFQPGDVITVSGWPHRIANKPQMFATEVKKADGTVPGVPMLPLAEAYPADPNARGIAGRWLPPWRGGEASERQPRPSGPGLPVTEAGYAAWARYDPAQSPIVTCEPMNVPTLFYPGYVFDLQLNGREVVFRHSLYDVTRTIPLNAAPQQVDADGFFGTATARMNGDELLIESGEYPPSKWGLAVAVIPLGNGGDVPSSAQKQVVERYSVSEDGRKLILEYTLQDPVYLKEPFSARVEMERLADDAPVEEFNCDPESAALFTGLPR